MHHYRQALLRMRLGDSDRDIAAARVMGRPKAAQWRRIAGERGSAWSASSDATVRPRRHLTSGPDAANGSLQSWSGQWRESRQKPARLQAAIHRIKIIRPLIAIAAYATSKPDDSNGHKAAAGAV